MDDKTFVLNSSECHEVYFALHAAIRECVNDLERVQGWVDYPDKVKQQEYIDFFSKKLNVLNSLVTKFS